MLPAWYIYYKCVRSRQSLKCFSCLIWYIFWFDICYKSPNALYAFLSPKTPAPGSYFAHLSFMLERSIARKPFQKDGDKNEKQVLGLNIISLTFTNLFKINIGFYFSKCLGTNSVCDGFLGHLKSFSKEFFFSRRKAAYILRLQSWHQVLTRKGWVW